MSDRGVAPHGAYPPGVYEMLLSTPDDVITATLSEPTPPVKIEPDLPG